MTFYRPTWVDISTEAFSSNIREIKKFIGNGVELLAVLKADAYGHGAELLAPLAIKNGASSIGVSSLEEGISLRRAGIKAPLLLLGGIFPLENFSVALEFDLIPTVASLDAYEALKKCASEKKKNAVFHLKVDTGMGRIGLSIEGAKRLLEKCAREKERGVAGIYSHLACADSDEAYTRQQLSDFLELKKTARQMGLADTRFHIANSAAIALMKESHHEMVRPGLALFGSSLVSWPSGVSLQPVLSWRTKAVFIKRVPPGTSISYGRTFVTKKESLIATLPVGYADGIPRSVSNKGFVLIKGKRCPIVGRVTMDQIMVDVTGVDTKVGEDVVLIGRQGADTLSAADWASWAGTIPYEIFCGISKRVPRVGVS